MGANLATLKLFLNNLGNAHIPAADLKTRSLNLLNESITDLRRLIHGFSPQSLALLGLANALHQTADSLTATGKLRVELHADPLPNAIGPAIETNLYRIVQELLQNAVKHSRATLVQLTLTAQPNGLTLTYTDDGRGFDPQVVGPNSHGLTNIQNRAQLLGGRCVLNTAPGAGVRIVVSVPLSSQNT